MKIQNHTLKYNTTNDLCLKLLNIMDTIYEWNLTPDQILILTYYIRFGYCRNTKDIILEETSITSIDSLNTQNYTLRSKGVLIEGRNNKNKSILSPELQKIKKIIESKSKGFLITLKENEPSKKIPNND